VRRIEIAAFVSSNAVSVFAWLSVPNPEVVGVKHVKHEGLAFRIENVANCPLGSALRMCIVDVDGMKIPGSRKFMRAALSLNQTEASILIRWSL